MKKKHLFLLLTVLWVVNACIGGYFLYNDFAAGATFSQDPDMLSHFLYMGTASVAAMLTCLQFVKHRNDD